MTIESDADLAAFFDLEGHAETGSYVPAAGGAALAVVVIVDRPDVSIDVGVSGIRAPSAHAKVRTAELPAGEKKGGTLTVAGAAYRVTRLLRDATRKVTTLELAEV